MAVTKYPYAAGKDPTYDAWKAKADYERQNAWYDAAQGQRKATEDYKNALAQLDQQQKVGTRSIDNSMLARGVFSSGETSRRQGEFGAQILGARSAADAAKAEAFGKISTDLQRALTSMDLSQEGQVQQSLARLRGGSGGGGGGGGGKPPSFYGNNAPPAADPFPTLPGQIAPPPRPGQTPTGPSWFYPGAWLKPKPKKPSAARGQAGVI